MILKTTSLGGKTPIIVAIGLVLVLASGWFVVSSMRAQAFSSDGVGKTPFSLIGTHPQAAAQPTANGRILKDVAVSGGKLYAAYGDWNVNTGPIHLNPLNLTTDTFEGSVLTVPTEAIDGFRTINGRLYAPMTDPTVPWGQNAGYAEQLADGSWVNRNHVPLVHVLDIATTDGNDLWLVGSDDAGLSAQGALAYRSTDGGATWQLAMSQASTPVWEFDRYHFAPVINGELYLRPSLRHAEVAPVKKFDGTSWSDIAVSGDRICTSNTVRPQQTVVFRDTFLCGSGTSMTMFNGETRDLTSESISGNLGQFRDFYVEGGQLYVLFEYGVARTSDLRHWEHVTDVSLPNTPSSLAVYQDRLYIGTEGSTVYKSERTISNIMNNAQTDIVVAVPEACFTFDVPSATITSYDAAGQDDCYKNPIIPHSIGGTPVRAIGNSAFAVKNLTAVRLPVALESVGMAAFSTNYLQTIALPAGLVTIDTAAFAQNKIREVILPSSLTTLGANAFNSNQVTSLHLNDGLTSIGRWAFANNALTTVAIPASVTTIGDAAFGNNDISSITVRGTPAVTGTPFAGNRVEEVHLPAATTTSLDYFAASGASALSSNDFMAIFIESGADAAVQWWNERRMVVRVYAPHIDSGMTSNILDPFDLSPYGFTGVMYGDVVLMNPARLAVEHRTVSGEVIAQSVAKVGPQLNDYSMAALRAAVHDLTTADFASLYYHADQEVTHASIEIPGYTAMATQRSIRLAAGSNTLVFAYAAMNRGETGMPGAPRAGVGRYDITIVVIIMGVIGIAVGIMWCAGRYVRRSSWHSH